MSRPSSSALYFRRTKQVDDFLEEFTKIRTFHLNSSKEENRERKDGSFTNSATPYRRAQGGGDIAESKTSDEAEDTLLQTAYEMQSGNSINLDAFTSLVVAYDKIIEDTQKRLRHRTEPRRFNLADILRDSTVVDRKFPKHTHQNRLEDNLRAVEELRYQRQVEDVRQAINKKHHRIAGFKPPIIAGMNTVFGVALTFFGAYSVAGALGIEDNLQVTMERP